MKKKYKISYNSPIILSFVFMCFVAVTVGYITNNRSIVMLFSTGGVLTSPLTYIKLFTHVLGHWDFEHFIGNSTYLLLIGPILEEKYGSSMMIKVFATTALVTGVVHNIFWGNYALCGASGIVFACIVLASFTSFKEGEIPLSFILVGILFIGKEVYMGLAIEDNISNITHVLGGVVGGIYGYMHNKK